MSNSVGGLASILVNTSVVKRADINVNSINTTLETVSFLQLADGTLATPPLTFQADTNLGICRNTGALSIVDGGNELVRHFNGSSDFNNFIRVAYQNGLESNPQITLRRSDGALNCKLYVDTVNSPHFINTSGSSPLYVEHASGGSITMRPYLPTITTVNFGIAYGDGSSSWTDILRVRETNGLVLSAGFQILKTFTQSSAGIYTASLSDYVINVTTLAAQINLPNPSAANVGKQYIVYGNGVTATVSTPGASSCFMVAGIATSTNILAATFKYAQYIYLTSTIVAVFLGA